MESIFDRITAADIAELEGILSDIERSCEASDLESLTEYDLRFHQAIIQSHDNKDLFTLWQPVAMRMMMHYTRLDDIMESYHEHKRILDAICSGNKAQALRALEANIQ